MDGGLSEVLRWAGQIILRVAVGMGAVFTGLGLQGEVEMDRTEEYN